MIVGFFSYRPEIEASLVEKLSQVHRVKTFECHLLPETSHLASECDALCLFVNDVFNPQCLPNIRRVVLRATGSDKITKSDAVRFDRIADYGPQSIAEYALGLVTQLAHPKVNLLFDSPFLLKCGRELMGKKAAVLGVGKIGHLMAKYLTALQMDVHCLDIVQEHADLKYCSSLDDALKDAFVISMHLPLNERTQGILHSLDQIPKGCILVNVGRSGLIKQEVILQGLQQKHFYGLGLDVFPGEEGDPAHNQFLKQIAKFKDNVLVTNHVAYLTEEALQRIHDQVLQIFTT